MMSDKTFWEDASWILIIIIMLTIMSFSVLGIQPTQQYNKIYLTPFYRESMSANTNYTYTLNINPPDKVSSVTSAIISFNAQINGQSQNFSLWINGQSCNNPSYYVATAFSTTGNTQIYFDCSNRIIQSGVYNVSLRSSVNTGTVQGWIDLVYMNKPLGSTDIFGTEYIEGDDGTIFLLLKDSEGLPISNATCSLDVYYPNIANASHPEWIDNGLMLYKEEGLYFYDFTVPLLTGLYMVNAQCSYITNNNYYYTLASGNSPIRNVSTGTYVGDTFVLNDYQEWLYDQCDSGIAGGGGKACDSWYQWNISGVNVSRLFVAYLGENSGANIMTMYWYNWTNNSWYVLPNTLTFKSTGAGGVPSGVDEYLSNTVPLQAIGNGSHTGIVRIRLLTSSGSTFKQWDNWLTLKTSQYGSAIQELKGSGEIHVSSAPSGINRFFKIFSCNGFIDGRCAYFTDDAEYDLLEGELEEIINISATSTKLSVPITYNTPFSVDCSALYWIKEWNGSSWVDFTDYDLYSQPAFENCIITLYKDLSSGTTYNFWFKMDNYMKWEVDWTKHISDSVNSSVQYLCNDRNFTYITPITDVTPTSNDSITDYCYQFMDDQYWINSYYTDSQSVSIAGEYASYVQEMRYYRPILSDRFMFLVLGNNTNMMSNFYVDKVWNHSVRNLTYYENFSIPQTDLTNYSRIGDIVWNYSNRNLTYYPLQVDLTNYSRISNLTAQQVWEYAVRNLTYYPNMTVIVNVNTTNVTVQNVTVVVQNVSVITQNVTVQNVSVTVDNYTIVVQNVSVITQNVTVENVSINTSQLSSDVWSYPVRNLTYYPEMNVTLIVNTTNVTVDNYTIIVQNVSVITQNVTVQNVSVTVDNYTIVVQNVSVITQNVTVQNVSINTTQLSYDVWNYPVRNLTYYENFTIPQTDLTNYSKISNLTAQEVWEYNNRNLTYYPEMNVTLYVNTTNVTVQNVTVVVQNVSVITQNVTVQNVSVTVDNYTIVVQNVSVITQNVTVENVSINTSQLSSDVWSYPVRNLTYYENFSVPQQDLTNYSKISNLTAQDVWEYNVRNLTYYPEMNVTLYVNTTNVTVDNYTIIVQNVSVITQNVTVQNVSVTVDNYTIVVQNVSVITQNVTVENVSINTSQIAVDVWNNPVRNLTYYPEMNVTLYVNTTDVTVDNYTIIVQNVSVITQNVTVQNISVTVDNYTIIVQNVSVITQNVTVENVSINTTQLSSDVWSYPVRNLTYYENFSVEQQDLTNYSKISNLTAQDVWNYPVRNLTYYENFTVEQQDLTNYSYIFSGVWAYYDRNLTYYPMQDAINYTLITDNVWNYVGRYIHGTII